MKPVFVLVTSESCPHCKTFKRYTWPRLSTYLKKDARLKLAEIHVMKNAKEITDRHNDLLRFATWAPTMMIFTGESWVSTKLVGKVLNGEFRYDARRKMDMMTNYANIPGKTSQLVNLNQRDIYDWIEATLKSSLFSAETPSVVITDKGTPKMTDSDTFTGNINFVPKVIDEYDEW